MCFANDWSKRRMNSTERGNVVSIAVVGRLILLHKGNVFRICYNRFF